MSPVDAWLAGRRPAPPRELAARMEAGRGEASAAEDASIQVVLRDLTRRGLEALDQARRRPGRVRESAYHLLTADALLTYACEAALEAPDPEASLEKLVSRAASPDR